MAVVSFRKGLVANLPATYTEGTLYATTDERALYLDISNSQRIRFGDFQEFATLQALQANTNPSATALYYVTELNVLAKWNGSGYVQINLDTGATSVEVVGEGNAVTAASYDPSTRKLTLTKGASYTTADDVSLAITNAVGDLGEIESVKGYIDGEIAEVNSALAGKQDTVAFNTTYNSETNKAATMADVQNAVADLSGAMHYEGNSTTDPATDGPTVEGHEDEWANGDVVTYNTKEFVYDGTSWRELGDESSFAIKGSIKNADIASDAAIDQSKIAGLTDALAGKATATDITDAIGALDVTDEAVAGQVVSAVSETDGKITVSRRALVADDIPELAQSKITDLATTLAGKQDTITFNTAYDASTNKAATMADVTSSMTWGSF